MVRPALTSVSSLLPATSGRRTSLGRLSPSQARLAATAALRQSCNSQRMACFAGSRFPLCSPPRTVLAPVCFFNRAARSEWAGLFNQLLVARHGAPFGAGSSFQSFTSRRVAKHVTKTPQCNTALYPTKAAAAKRSPTAVCWPRLAGKR